MRKKIIAVLSLVAAFTVSLFGMSACTDGTSSENSSSSIERPAGSDSSTGGEDSTSDKDSTSDSSSEDSSTGDSSSDDSSTGDSSSDDSSTGSGTGDETPVPAISLNKTTLSISEYNCESLTATLVNSSEIINWTSSNEDVAKVVDGTVIAVGVGSATITVSAGDVSATCEVTVTEGATPEFTEISESMSIIKGKTKTLDTEMSLGDEVFSGATYTFAVETIDGEAVVSVDEEGAITALNYGTQSVTVKAYF